MARIGRFGRTLREAPDLTASIVAMMRQYRAQQDQNMFDAWENGGEYEGRKVTDAMLLSHIKSRRDELDKDDPLWDEWNNRLWQYRFTIAEQKANLKYQRALASAARIDTSTRGGAAAYASAQSAANAAMRGFYTQWARRLPRRSAAYRDLMASAAQYSRAAALAQQRSRSATKTTDPAAEYKQYVARVNAIEREYVQPMKTVMSALNAFAQARGLLPEGGNILDMETGAASGLWEALADGVQSDPSWPYLKRQLQRALPDGLYHGGLSLDLLERLSRRAQQGIRMQVAAAKAYPGDLSSHVASFREDMRDVRAARALDTRLSAADDIMDGYDAYQEAISGATDPLQWTGADKQAFIGDLQRAYAKFMQAKDYAAAGEVRNSIAALSGNTETIRLVGGNPVWGGSQTMQEVAMVEAQMNVWAQGIRSGGMYVIQQPESPTGAISYEQRFTVHSFIEEPMAAGRMALVTQVSPDGTIVPVAVPLKPVYLTPDSTDAELYVAEYDGQRMFVRYLSRADGTVVPSWTGDAAMRSTGMLLKSDRDGYVMVNQSDTSLNRIRTAFEPPGVDLYRTPEEQAEQDEFEAEQAAAAADRASMLRTAGIVQVGDGYVSMGNAMDEQAISDAVRAIDEGIEQRWGQAGVPNVPSQAGPVENMLPGSMGSEAYAVQQGLAFNTPYLSSPSSIIANLMNNPTLAEAFRGREAELLNVIAQEPNMVGQTYGEAYRSLMGLSDSMRLSPGEAAAAAEGSSNPRIGAGAGAGSDWASRIDWASWDRMAAAMGETADETDRISMAGRGVVSGAQNAATTIGNAAGGVMDILGGIGRAIGDVIDLPGPPPVPDLDRGAQQPTVKVPHLPGVAPLSDEGGLAPGAPPPPPTPVAPVVQMPTFQPPPPTVTFGGSPPPPPTTGSGRSRGGSWTPPSDSSGANFHPPSSSVPTQEQLNPTEEEADERWNPRGSGTRIR
jgi:hypothetical protein